MNIKDFLIDNYIWIIVIILITIITIIGFLADKKRGKKTKESAPSASPNPNNTQSNNMSQMQYQPPTTEIQNTMNNNMGINNNADINQVQPPMNSFGLQPSHNIINNQELGQPNSSISMPGDTNSTSNLQPIDFQTPSISQESMYQPLSDQKPNIPPHPIPDYSNNQNIITPVDNNFNQNNNSTIPMGLPSQNIQQPVPTQQLSDSMNNNFIGGMQEFNQNNTTMPNPVNQIPVPQPVSPQPIMSNNNVDMMNTTNYNYNPNSTIPMGLPSQNIQQPMPTPQQMQSQMNPTMGMNYNPDFTGTPQTINPQPANPNQPLPINFVYGPQNNNQNM